MTVKARDPRDYEERNVIQRQSEIDIMQLWDSSNVSSEAMTKPGLRHVTILFSEIVNFEEWTRKLGDLEVAQIAKRLLTLQEIIITRDGVGQLLQLRSDSVFAVFNNASAALNRSLEIQRVLDGVATHQGAAASPRLRIGLHMGEVLVREGDRIEIISRHVSRARRVMEVAREGQILASEAVVEAARDFIDIPKEVQGIQYFGEYYLKSVGATNLCEVADLRFRKPQAPDIPDTRKAEMALWGRLELAGYQPITRLGEGAYGVVYEAMQISSQQRVAVKVLSPALCEDPDARHRFAQEAARMHQLKLPGLARIMDARLDHTPPFFVMELIEGKPVDAALAQASPQRLATVFREICSVLEQAHRAGIVHCDLKPGNILIRADDSPVILDFGISVLQSDGDQTSLSSSNLAGTPTYLAPEVIRGCARGPFTDLYSIGILLFRVLTGRDPFPGDSIHQIIQAHLHEDPPLPAMIQPDVSDGLQRICLKALEKNPHDRYQRARQMADDLDRFLRGEVVRTRPSVYDNLLFHRVQQHFDQVRDWGRRGLLSTEEAQRLLASYEGLQRRGIPAVMESRIYRFWQTLVYLGGWAVVNGSVLWLIQHWSVLSRPEKLLLGSVPALTSFALAVGMWKLERFRLTFVAFTVGILAVPLLIGVWLKEFKVVGAVPTHELAQELLHREADSDSLTNRQLLIISLSAALVAAAVMLFTSTTTHSAQTVIAFLFLYSACLLFQGLVDHLDDAEFAALALKYSPLILFITGVAKLLVENPRRHFQAAPWIYVGSLVFLVVSDALPLYGLKEWTKFELQIRTPLQYLLLFLSGGMQATVGLLMRNYLKHRCRLASLMVILSGLVTALAGLSLAGWEDTWPQTWWKPEVFGSQVPAPLLIVPVLSLLITLLACRFQLFTFLLVGLLGFAGSIHGLGYLYFEANSAWPKSMIFAGTICFFAALGLELRRTHGNTIDDLVTQQRL